MGVSLDLAKAAFSRLHGDILAIYTWVNDERALVLLPAHRKARSPWYIVCESAAHKYADEKYLARQAKTAAEVLGMDETQFSWVRIATIIIEGLPDLIRMPSAQPDRKIGASRGQMTMLEDGKPIAGEEIRFEKPTAEYVFS